MRMLPLGPYGCLCRQSARSGHRPPAYTAPGRKGAHPVNRDREIANPPRPAQTRPIAADEALSTRVDLAPAGGPHASPARRPASDSLTSIVDFRSIFRLGRTAAYELTRQPGFPDPVMVSARCHRWRASGVDAFDVGRCRDRDEPIASTAACSGLRWEERGALADSGRRTPAPRDPPLMRKALRARPAALPSTRRTSSPAANVSPETALAPAVPFPAVAIEFEP
jgi:predicted DNA-binding transcriptional regulator AlpA